MEHGLASHALALFDGFATCLRERFLFQSPKMNDLGAGRISVLHVLEQLVEMRLIVRVDGEMVCREALKMFCRLHGNAIVTALKQ